MEEDRKEILAAAKIMLGIETDENDGLLTLIIDDVINAILAYCGIDVLPRQIVSFIPTIVSKRFRSNSNNGVKSISEGERRVEYCDEEYDFLKEYALRLKPFVNRKVRVPSDLEVENDKSV